MIVHPKKGLLLVANWDSDVGYAWWLMESFWVLLSEAYHNHRVILAYPSISNIPNSIMQADIECFRADFTLTSVNAVIKQCYFLRKNNIRIIYFSDHKYWHWRYIAFRLFGVKVIVNHDHTPGLGTVPVGLKKKLKSIIVNLPGISADAIIGATPYIKQRAIAVARFSKERTYAAPNGLPTCLPQSPINLHRVFNIPLERKIMVTTARASKYKGVFFAINCILNIVKRCKRRDFHWFFCGDGPALDEFKALVRENEIDDFITFAGRRGDVPAILRSCQFAFHPSFGEVGYSLSILEYMQAGLPVVVSDNPSVCGATEDEVTGLIYEEGNIESACKLIIRLLNDEHAIELGNNAKKKSQEYTLDNTHTQLLKAMSSIDRVLRNENQIT